jgi:hypothetical protein
MEAHGCTVRPDGIRGERPRGRGRGVLVDGAPVPLLSDGGLVRVLNVPPGADVEVVAGRSPTRTGLLQAQALWALLVISFGARPPAFALRGARPDPDAGPEPEPGPRSEAVDV